ncbi:MAG TPA: SpaA isopeptide-forming pilin-related protein [Methanobrevibacter smithii]|nr:SpaA isopeptide-forming pilin-related protein [Methanobrevibacter smithii]HJJ02132.1 SpaA isopeptide-forming pilin-related protein [Methanobrevibacter smithii]
MSEEMTLKDLQSNFMDLNSGMQELQKAMQTTMNANAVMPVEWDPELKKRVSLQTPYLEFLKSQGCVKSTAKVKVGYKLKENKTRTNFMLEDDEIQSYTPSDFDKRVAFMKILHYNINMGDIAEKAAEFDLFKDDLEDGLIDMANTLDYTLLEGAGEEETKDFKGLFKTIHTNTFDLGGDLLTKDDIVSIVEAIIQENGYPTGLVATPEVANQINDLYFPGTVKPLEYELTAGYKVTGIYTAAGNIIPIIVDRHVDTSKGEKLAVVDTSSIKVREFQPPTVVPFAKTKLATSQSIIQVITQYNDAEYKNGMITGIGRDEDRKTKTKLGNINFNIMGTDGKPVKGAKVSFTDEKNNVFKSGTSNNRGLAEMIQVPYGTYNVDYDTIPAGYTKIAIADYDVSAAESRVSLILTKN